jgi:hypothetical protein
MQTAFVLSGLLSMALFSTAMAEEVLLKPFAPASAVYNTETLQSPSHLPSQTIGIHPQQAEIPSIPNNWDEPILRGQSSETPESQTSSQAAFQTSQNNSPNQALQITTTTEKVPTGTILKIAFNTPMDSRVSLTGEPFTATLQEDFYTFRRVDGEPEKRVILPQGTMLRGRASDVKRPGLFSKGGAISLSFDHVVLPSGELLPLAMNLSNTNPIVNQAGALYTDPGVGKKVNQGVQKGFFTFNKVKDATVKAGEDAGGDLGKIFAAPFAVAGGAVASGAVITGKTVVAIVGKGDSVVINPGDTLSIDFAGAFNLPSQ